LSVELTEVVANLVAEAFGTGIYVRDNAANSGNHVVNNRVVPIKAQGAPAVLLEQAPGTRVSGNKISNPE
jgi:hypothetical protein